MKQFLLRNKADVNSVIRFLQTLDISKGKTLTITNAESIRSDAQNRLLWLWNNEIQKHMREVFGMYASAEEWHEQLVSRLCPAELTMAKLPGGNWFMVGRSRTSSFGVKQMSEYLNLLDMYCAEELQLALPHPEDLMMAAYGSRVRRVNQSDSPEW